MSKKRIITYGLKYDDFEPQRELFALQAAGEIEIVAELAYDPADKEIFGRRMDLQDALKSDYDMIIDCGGSVDETISELAASGVNISPESVADIGLLAGPFNETVKADQIKLLKEIVSASDDEIRDREWLRKRIYDYGFYPFFKLVKSPQPGVRFSTAGVLQVPDEFLDYLMFLSGHKCDSAVEVGVARGGSSYIMAALLYRNNPSMKYHMVDIFDGLISFDVASKIIPSLVKDIPHTSDDFAGQVFDYCFIDADHSYEGMMTDWNNLGRHARKLTVFHDIYAHEYDDLDGGTVRGWQEIKASVEPERIREYSLYPDKWMGIGVVRM